MEEARLVIRLISINPTSQQEVRVSAMPTNVRLSLQGEPQLACCSLDTEILVLVFAYSLQYAALVTPGAGPTPTYKVQELQIYDEVIANGTPFLWKGQGGKAFLDLGRGSGIWVCNLFKGSVSASISIRPWSEPFCDRSGPGSVPVPVSQGNSVVVGADPPSRELLNVRNGYYQPWIPEIPDFPVARSQTSVTVLGERYVVGFGGRGPKGELLCDLYVVDLHFGTKQTLKAKGDWPQGDTLVPLVLRGNNIYFLGGWSGEVWRISLADLANLLNSFLGEGIRAVSLRQTGSAHRPSSYQAPKCAWGQERNYCQRSALVDIWGRQMSAPPEPRSSVVSKVVGVAVGVAFAAWKLFKHKVLFKF